MKDDLIQEGAMAIKETARKFNPRKGVKFAYFAKWDIKHSMIKTIRNYQNTIELTSLDASLSEDDDKSDFSLYSITSIDSEDTAFEETALFELDKKIKDLLSGLRPREEEVLRRRMGFYSGGGEIPTLKEIGEDFEVSGERIRQIEFVALKKLKSKIKKKEFKDLKYFLYR
ncbi:MAG: sigma-70 family RNA polymerase sigma factor [archaeon]